MVCILGPGVSLYRDSHIDPTFAKEQLLDDGLPVVPARERPVPGLRMEFRRCESARAVLGGVVRIPD